jgi:hypothetical protein
MRGRAGRWLAQCLAVGLLVTGFLGGVVWLGRWGLEQIRGQDRYLVPFAEIDCGAPEGLDRQVFLDEVQYLGRLPDRLDVLDDELPDRLRQAFALHPWVAKVGEVTRTPPRHVAVALTFRTPVLAVKWDGELRAVDGAGVLLPKNAPTRGLPVYDGEPRPPRGPPGTRWGDPDLEREARKLHGGK